MKLIVSMRSLINFSFSRKKKLIISSYIHPVFN